MCPKDLQMPNFRNENFYMRKKKGEKGEGTQGRMGNGKGEEMQAGMGKVVGCLKFSLFIFSMVFWLKF